MKTLVQQTRPSSPVGSSRRRSRIGPVRRRQSGFTIIEALVASLIMAVSVSAMVSLFYFAFNMTVKADNQGVAYTIGRREMEQIKLAGFDFAQDGRTVTGYDKVGNPAAGAAVVFQATTSITTYGSPGSYASHRIVNISVTTVQNARDTLYQSGTQLSKAGI